MTTKTTYMIVVAAVVAAIVGGIVYYAPAPTAPNTPPVQEPPVVTPPVNAPVIFGASRSFSVGETAMYPDGLTVTLDRIDDSRCAAGVVCIWAGELSGTFRLSGGSLKEPVELLVGTSKTVPMAVNGYGFSVNADSTTSIELLVTMDPLISVQSPTTGQVVSGKLEVKGFAPGTWYFEASFPVKLLDGTGKELLVVPAQAQGEWMTEDFVPYAVTIDVPAGLTGKGMLILQKDNPSGLPEHDDSRSIPVLFAVPPDMQ